MTASKHRRSDRDELLNCLQNMCSHEPLVSEGALPELVPAPLAVTRQSGLMAFTVRDVYDWKLASGAEVRCGDTLIVDPTRSYGPGSVLLVSDGSEFTVAEVAADGGYLFLLRDGEHVGLDTLVLGVVTELRHAVGAR